MLVGGRPLGGAHNRRRSAPPERPCSPMRPNVRARSSGSAPQKQCMPSIICGTAAVARLLEPGDHLADATSVAVNEAACSSSPAIEVILGPAQPSICPDGAAGDGHVLLPRVPMTIPFVVVTGPTGLRRCAARRPRTPPAAHSPRFPGAAAAPFEASWRREARALRRGVSETGSICARCSQAGAQSSAEAGRGR